MFNWRHAPHKKPKKDRPRPREKQSQIPKVPKDHNGSKSTPGQFKPEFKKASEINGSSNQSV